MDYGEILSKAWKIIWKFKVLWIFGLLSSCGQAVGSGAGANAGSGGQSGSTNGWHPQNLPPQLQNVITAVERSFQDGSAWIYILGFALAALCLGVIFSLITMAISSAGKIGVINGTVLADEGASKMTFSQLWNGMKPYFKRVFIFSFLISIAGMIAVLILSIPFIMLAVVTLGCGIFLMLPVLIIVGWLVGVWIDQTIVAIVVEDLEIRPAASRAWELIKANFWRYIGMSAILFIGGFIVSFLIALPIILAVLPGMASLIYGVSENSGSFIGIGAILLVCLCALMVPVSMAVNGLVYAYIGSAWTLTFRRMTGKMPAREDNEIIPAPVNDREIEEKPDTF